MSLQGTLEEEDEDPTPHHPNHTTPPQPNTTQQHKIKRPSIFLRIFGE